MCERRTVTTAEAIAWLMDKRTESSDAQRSYMQWWAAEQKELAER